MKDEEDWNKHVLLKKKKKRKSPEVLASSSSSPTSFWIPRIYSPGLLGISSVNWWKWYLSDHSQQACPRSLRSLQMLRAISLQTLGTQSMWEKRQSHASLIGDEDIESWISKNYRGREIIFYLEKRKMGEEEQKPTFPDHLCLDKQDNRYFCMPQFERYTKCR